MFLVSIYWIGKNNVIYFYFMLNAWLILIGCFVFLFAFPIPGFVPVLFVQVNCVSFFFYMFLQIPFLLVYVAPIPANLYWHINDDRVW